MVSALSIHAWPILRSNHREIGSLVEQNRFVWYFLRCSQLRTVLPVHFMGCYSVRWFYCLLCRPVLRCGTLAGTIGSLSADTENYLPLPQSCEGWNTDNIMDTNCNLTSLPPTIKNDEFASPHNMCNSISGKHDTYSILWPVWYLFCGFLQIAFSWVLQGVYWEFHFIVTISIGPVNNTNRWCLHIIFIIS